MKINLLPPPPPKVRRFFLLYWLGVGIVLLIIVVMGVNFLNSQMLLKSRQSAFEQVSQSLLQIQGNINKYKNQTGSTGQIGNLQLLRAALPQPVEVVKNLSSLLPNDGSLASVNYASGTFTVSAILGSYQEAVTFITALRNDSMVTNVNVTSISAVAGGSSKGQIVTVPFSVTLVPGVTVNSGH